MYIAPNTVQWMGDDTSTTPKKALCTGRPSTSVHVLANFEPGKDDLSSDRWDMIKVVIVMNDILKLVQKV